MHTEKCFFENARGERLAAIIDFPLDKTPHAYAIFAHCFTCNKNFKAITHISRVLNQSGIAVMRFDFTGLGDSEGDFSTTDFSSNVEDIRHAVTFLSEQYEAPRLLIGHSFGAAAVLHGAPQLDCIKAVVTIAGPATPSHVLTHLNVSRANIETLTSVNINVGGRSYELPKAFFENVLQADIQPSIADLNKALLVMHSPLDTTVEIEQAGKIFAAAKHPKSFVSLDQADHLLSRAEDADYAGKIIAAWASRYL